jgi:toxin CptA
MHNAPSVVYPLGRSGFLAWLLLGLWLAGALLAVFWFYVIRQLDWRMVLTIAAVLGAGAAARTSWTRIPVGQLAWDGEAWRWESASYQTGIAVYELSVIADFQRRLLLRLENQAHARLWLWVERSAMPDRWLDLRRAVYSPRKSSISMGLHGALQAEPLLAVAVLGSMPPADVAPTKP